MDAAIPSAREPTDYTADRPPRPPGLLPALRLPARRGDLRHHERLRRAAGGLDGAPAARLHGRASAAASATPRPSADAPDRSAPWPVPAHAHRAPRARVVAGEVVERPVAVLRGAAFSRSHVPSAAATATIASTARPRRPPSARGAPPAERDRARRPARAAGSTSTPLCASSTPRSASRTARTRSSRPPPRQAEPVRHQPRDRQFVRARRRRRAC